MTTPLLIALLAGPPLALLALAIAYAAQVMAHRPALTTHAPSSAESGPPARDVKLIEHLQHSVIDLQRQLGAQRDALTELLSERREEHVSPARHTQPIAEPVTADTRASQRRRTPTRSGVPRASVASAATLTDNVGDPGSREQRVRQLLAEGMPERAVARELRIGIEEVQLLATPSGAGRAS